MSKIGLGILLVCIMGGLYAFVSFAGRERQRRLDREFGAAIEGALVKDRVRPLRDWLRQGADIRARGPHGATALMWAAWDGDYEVATQALQAGVPVNVRDGGGATALIYAGHARDPAIAELLLRHGAAVNARSPGGFGPLGMAILYHRLTTAKALLSAGADPKERSPGEYTLLTSPIRDGLVREVRLLLDAGADPTLPTARGNDLRYGLHLGNPKVVSLLHAWARRHSAADAALRRERHWPAPVARCGSPAS